MNLFIANDLPRLAFAQQIFYLDRQTTAEASLFFEAVRKGVNLDLAYGQLFRWKGLLTESLGWQGLLTDGGITGQLRDQLGKLTRTRSSIAGLVAAQRLLPSAEFSSRIDQLTTEQEDLESALTPIFAQRIAKRADLNMGMLRSSLQDREALVDVYRTSSARPDNNDASYVAAYVAVLVLPKGHTKRVYLGTASKIDDVADRWRSAVLKKEMAEYEWNELVDALWTPIVTSLPADIQKVWLSPDGPLLQLPWNLFCNDKRRAIRLTQIDSGRELISLRRSVSEKTSKKPEHMLLIGGVDYDANPQSTKAASSGLNFHRLDETLIEAQNIEILARGKGISTKLLTALLPTKAILMSEMPKMDFIHLATHGYFLQPPETKTTVDTGVTVGNQGLWISMSTSGLEQHPLSESGLALAGANIVLDSGEDGLLSAEEIVGLNLTRAKLVVLSACETGRGEEFSGQGVLGFRAAFMSTNTRSLVLSLWKVDDEATRILMENFYQHLWQENMNKFDALNAAQEFLRNTKEEFRKPIYWAAWIIVGDAW